MIVSETAGLPPMVRNDFPAVYHGESDTPPAEDVTTRDCGKENESRPQNR
jgi:hypothetical protein